MNADVLRIIGLAILLTATLIDPMNVKFIVRPDVQVVCAAVVVFIVLFVDHIFGFVLGLAVITLYARVFMDTYGMSAFPSRNVPYVTPANLEDAQSNIFNEKNVNTPYVGAKGVHGEAVYSAQGLDASMPGFEKSIGGDFSE
jgi:uncharacterized membrane protein required for colicin V production